MTWLVVVRFGGDVAEWSAALAQLHATLTGEAAELFARWTVGCRRVGGGPPTGTALRWTKNASNAPCAGGVEASCLTRADNRGAGGCWQCHDAAGARL